MFDLPFDKWHLQYIWCPDESFELAKLPGI